MFLASGLGAFLAAASHSVPAVYVGFVAFGVVALLFLVCNELLIEARLKYLLLELLICKNELKICWSALIYDENHELNFIVLFLVVILTLLINILILINGCL